MTKYDKCFENHQEVMISNLVGCLINEEKVSIPDTSEGISGIIDMIEATVFDGDDGSEFFIQNGILETFSNNYIEGLIEIYKRQVTTNNNRKMVLENKLRDRLASPVY